MDWPTLFLAAGIAVVAVLGTFGVQIVECIMLHLAARKVHPLGDPCDKLSDEDADCDTGAFGSGFPGHVAWGSPAHLEACARLNGMDLPSGVKGERISHSTETTR